MKTTKITGSPTKARETNILLKTLIALLAKTAGSHSGYPLGLRAERGPNASRQSIA